MTVPLETHFENHRGMCYRFKIALVIVLLSGMEAPTSSNSSSALPLHASEDYIEKDAGMCIGFSEYLIS